jgi:hypothetical protein
MSYNVNLVPNIAAVGTVRQYAFPPMGATDPNGWVICDGNLRSNATGIYNNLISRGLYNLNSFTINAIVNSTLGASTWSTLSLSNDATRQLVGGSSTLLYVSTNSGTNFTSIASIGSKSWTGTAISLNNQIMNACATGDYTYTSTDSGKTWANQMPNTSYILPSASTIGKSWSAVQQITYNNIGQNWTLLATSTGLVTNASFYNVSMSSTGQFILAGIYGGATYFSTNYGTKWTATPTGLSASANYTGSSISSTGQYMLVSTSTGTNYFSNTYGSSFTITSATGATGCASSVDGKYLLSANWLSSNYGANWAAIASGTGITTTNVNFWKPAISATGQYMILTSKQSAAGSPVNISTSYGSFWTQNPISGMSTSAAATGSAISASGQFMVVLVLGGSVYLSSTYGANWVQTPGTGLAVSANYYSATMSSSGQYILIGGNAGTVNSAALSYFSSNYGANWLSAIGTPVQSYGISVAMSSDGQYMLNVGYGNAGVYMSTATYSTSLGTNSLSRYGPTLTFQQIPTITNFSQTSVTNTGTNLPADMGSPTFGMDGTGQYMLIADSSTSTNKGAFVTSNYGTSWTQLGTTQGLPATVTNAACIQVAGNGYMVMMRLNGGTYNNIYLSVNYGKNWTSVFSSLPITPNNITMSANGQVIMYAIQAASNTTIYSTTNTGSTWGTLSKMAMGFSASGTGQYLCVSQYNGGGSQTVQFFISSNYGVSFTTVQTTASTCYCTAISYSGEYMLVTDLYTQVWVSSNFGVTFKNTQWGGGVQWCTVSYTGQYMTVNATGRISTNYGVNWTENTFSSSISRQSLTYYGEYFAGISGGTLKISSSTISSYANSSTVNSPTIITNFYRSSYGTTWVTNPGTGLPGSSFSNATVVMSGTGQYILCGDSSTRGVFLSSNFGNNWGQLGTAQGFPATVTSTLNLYVASGGQYMAFPYVPTGFLWISSNSGAYWYNSNRSVGAQLAMITISGNGQYMMYNTGTGNANYGITLSSDFGKTWAGITKTGFGISMSYTGQYMCIGQNNYPSLTAQIFVSKDFGVTFSTIASTGSVYYITTTSGNGEYMMAQDSAGGNSHLSSNFGVSFTLISALSGKNAYCCFMSYTGQYIISSTSYLSTNYGINWTSIPLLTQTRFVFTTYYGEYIAGSASTLQVSVPTSTLTSSSSTLVVPNPYWYSVTTDSTGQYVVVGSIMNQGIWCSTDFATTWQGTNQGIGTVQQLANSGTNMIAAINNLQGIYYSSNNGGVWQVATTQTSNNYISVAMSSSASYGLAGSIGGGVVYSSTNGQSWALSNLTTGTYGAVALSSSGQYGLASNNTTIYYSSNSGQTFIASSLTTVNAQSLAISQTGQYAAAGTTSGIYYSTSYGLNWTQATGQASTGTWYGINIMSSGQYLVAGNAGQGLWYSLNFGQTWTQSTTNTTDTWYEISTTPSGSYLYAVSQSTTIYQETNVTETISVNGLPLGTNAWLCAAMDSTGTYQLYGINNGYVYYSNNAGISWSVLSGNGLPNVTNVWQTVSISSTGQYILLGANPGGLYMSMNNATSWTAISGGTSTAYGMTINSSNWKSTAMNSTGQYMLAATNNANVYLSTNSGSYWSTIGGISPANGYLPTVASTWNSVAISSTGQFMAITVAGGSFYFSNSYGASFSINNSSPFSSTTNWNTLSMSGSGLNVLATFQGSSIYNITTNITPVSTSFTPPLLSTTTSTDGTTIKYIMKY